MAKRKIVPVVLDVPDLPVYTNKKRDLYSYTSFIYEVTINICAKNIYYLHDTFKVSLTGFRKEKKYYTRKGGNTIIRDYVLIAAPEEWLKEKNFIKKNGVNAD